MKLIILVAFFVCFDISSAANDTACGDWEPFNDDYCFKIFDNSSTQSFVDAEKTCQQNGATLISIHFREEQDFLTNYIFTKSKVVDNVWIGAKYVDSKFQWQDKSDLTFTNWATGSPTNLSDYCVQMHSDVGSVGKWVDEPCAKKNLVVCQKKQTWSLSRLQEILMEVKRNPVPIGFTYVQLPKDKSPAEIWPWMIWTDVSSDYAGVFFRVEGGDAAAFGTKQSDNAPRLTGVKWGRENGKTETQTKLGDWSDWCVSGSDGGSMYYSNSHQMSSGEVRPVNMAIRVWKRTG